MKKLLSSTVAIMFILSLVSTSYVSAQTNAEIKITSPKEGETIKSSDLTTEFSVSNFEIISPKADLKNETGKGHVHGFLDNDDNYVAITEKSYKFERLTNGEHKLKLELHNHDHSIYSPKVSKEVKFKVKVGVEKSKDTDVTESNKSVDSKDKKIENPKLRNINRKQKLLEKLDIYKDKLDKLDNSTLEKFLSLPPGIAKNIIKNPDLESNLQKFVIKQLSKNELERAFGKRFISAEKIKISDDTVKKSKEKLEKAEEDLKEKKEKFKKAKTLDSAKDYLIKVLDSLNERIDKLKAKTESSKDLSEEKVKETIADLDSKSKEIDDWKTKINSAKTKSELKVLVKEIADGWKHHDSQLKLHGWRVSLEHFGGILKQVNHLDGKLNKLLVFAEKNNITIGDKEKRVSDFENKLVSAKESYRKSVENFKNLKELVQNKTGTITSEQITERKSLTESIQSNLKDAKKSLREARELLVGIVKDLVKQLKEINLISESGKPVEVTEETVLDPTKVIEGVDTEEGKGTIELVEEESTEL